MRVECLAAAMAYTESMAMTATIFLAVMALVTAQAPSPSPDAVAPSPPITCTLPNSSMVSSNYCNSLDQSSMQSQTQDCTAFLTDIDPTPSMACCTGFNEVAYNRTACICMATFYPSSNYNASRALDLPSLCRVQTNLCHSCPDFIISRSQGPAASQTCKFSRLTSLLQGFSWSTM